MHLKEWGNADSVGRVKMEPSVYFVHGGQIGMSNMDAKGCVYVCL